MRIPKYYLVKNEILDLISDLDPGDGIPTERELADRYATSRTTVRQAIAELVVDGRLVRTQGRGTYVAHPKLMRVRPLTSFSQDLREEGWSPGARILDLAEVAADRQLADRLDVPVGERVLRLDRLRTADGAPIAHETAHLPGALPGLANHLARHGSLYRALRESYGRGVDTVEDLVETGLASPIEADLLGGETGLPMLVVHRTAWDASGRVVEWTRSAFRGDRFRFAVRHRLGEE